jgi:tRNA(Ile)-lysidine synthase
MTLAPVERVARFAEQELLFRRVSTVLVAVSGGPDSLAALLLLRDLRARFGFELMAAHFDHRLRDGSDADLRWVRDLCDRLGITCLTGEGDPAAFRAARGSREDVARRMRYQFLAFVAGEKRADCIATGHTADDQAETVLLRILRGTGVRGIRGMLPAGPVPGSPGQRLIRPLLCLRRDDTAAVCQEAGIEPLHDPSNDDRSFARNRVRHDVIPYLEAVNPSLRRALNGLAASAREVFDAVERRSFEVQVSARTPAGSIVPLRSLVSLPSEALTLVLEREAAFHHREIAVDRTRVALLRRILAAGAGRARFGALEVEVSSGAVRIGPILDVTPLEPKILDVPGTTRAGDLRIEVATSPWPPAPGVPVAAIPLSAVHGALRVRALRPGDRIRYHAIDRKVADLLSNEKVPTWDRRTAIVIADSDHVLAVLTASGAFVADGSPDDALYVRAAALPRS